MKSLREAQQTHVEIGSHAGRYPPGGLSATTATRFFLAADLRPSSEPSLASGLGGLTPCPISGLPSEGVHSSRCDSDRERGNLLRGFWRLHAESCASSMSKPYGASHVGRFPVIPRWEKRHSLYRSHQTGWCFSKSLHSPVPAIRSSGCRDPLAQPSRRTVQTATFWGSAILQ